MELSLSSSMRKIRAWCPKATLGKPRTDDSLLVLSKFSEITLRQPHIAILSFLVLALGVVWAATAIGGLGVTQLFSGGLVEGGLWLVSSGLLLFLVFLSWTLERAASKGHPPELEYLVILTLGYYSVYALAEQFRAFRWVFGFQISAEVPTFFPLLQVLSFVPSILFGFTLLRISKTLLAKQGLGQVSPTLVSLCMLSFGFGGLVNVLASSSLPIADTGRPNPVDSLYSLARILDNLGMLVTHVPFILLGLQVYSRKTLEGRTILIGAVSIASGWLTSNVSQVLCDIAARFLYRTRLLTLDDLLWLVLLVAVSLLSLAVIVPRLRGRPLSHMNNRFVATAIFLYATIHLGGLLLDVSRYRGWYIVGLLHLPYIIPLVATGILLRKTPISQAPGLGKEVHDNGGERSIHECNA